MYAFGFFVASFMNLAMGKPWDFDLVVTDKMLKYRSPKKDTLLRMEDLLAVYATCNAMAMDLIFSALI